MPSLTLRFQIGIFLLCIAATLSAQEVFINTANTIYRYNQTNGQTQAVSTITDGFLFDITFHPDGSLYALTAAGEIRSINLANGAQTVVATLPEEGSNSLTAASDGRLVIAGVRLWFHDLLTNQTTMQGFLPEPAGGDLIHYQGALYCTSFMDNIWRIDENDPGNSTMVINADIPGFLTSLFLQVPDCDNTTVYAVSGTFDSIPDNQSRIYEVSFAGNQLIPIDSIRFDVSGAATRFEYTESELLSIEDFSVDFPNCDLLGDISVTPRGGRPPYTYIRWGQPPQNENNFERLPLGLYEITVRDALGCEVFLEVEVSGEPSPTLDPPEVNFLGCTDSASVSLFGGGNGPLTYSIDGGNSFGTDREFIVLANESYDARVRDVNGCERFLRVDVPSSENPVIGEVIIDPACGDDESVISLQVSGGRGRVQFSLDDLAYGNEAQFTGLPEGTYTLFARDTLGCLDSAQVELPDQVRLDAILPSATTCGRQNGSVELEVTGGRAPYQSLINGQAFATTDSTLQALAAGDYSVQVMDATDCTTSLRSFTISDSEPLRITGLNILPPGCGDTGGEVRIGLPDRVVLAEVFLQDSLIAPATLIQNLNSGNYNLAITSTDGCTAAQAFDLRPSPCDIYIPSVFSPNDDGINDLFSLFPEPGAAGRITEVAIFDRWGGQVINLTELPITQEVPLWDGTYLGKQAMIGLYVYVLKVALDNGITQTLSGEVQLVR